MSEFSGFAGGFAAVVYWVAICGFGVTAVLALVRIVRGPTILDRMVASDVLLTTLMLAVGADMVLRGETYGVPMLLVIAATATLATIIVARYVRRRSLREKLLHPAGRESAVASVSDVGARSAGSAADEGVR